MLYDFFITKDGTYTIFNDKHYFMPNNHYFKFEISAKAYRRAYYSAFHELYHNAKVKEN